MSLSYLQRKQALFQESTMFPLLIYYQNIESLLIPDWEIIIYIHVINILKEVAELPLLTLKK